MDTTTLLPKIPIEIYHKIAAYDELSYRALLNIPEFARTLTIGDILDYMILFGRNVLVRTIGPCNKISMYWFKYDLVHRIGGPAVICADGSAEYRQNGQLHRTDGPAKIYSCGRIEYWYRGKLHRSDGPAIIDNHYKEYWQHGQRHRADGPALIYADGMTEYIVRGKWISVDEFWALT